jgi:hypothetical protein
MDDDPLENPNEDEDKKYELQQNQAILADRKISQLIALSSRSEVKPAKDDDGNIYSNAKLIIEAPETDSVLRRIGYSKVNLDRSTAVMDNSIPLYPWITIITAYDLNDIESDKFYVFQPSKALYILKATEGTGYVMIGNDIETGGVTSDMERIDPNATSDMLPEQYRHVTDQEYLTLISIITGCEADDR